jgi:hypothetical protein
MEFSTYYHHAAGYTHRYVRRSVGLPRSAKHAPSFDSGHETSSCLAPPHDTHTKARHAPGFRLRVAGAGIEPASGGYEPPEVPLLYPAMFIMTRARSRTSTVYTIYKEISRFSARWCISSRLLTLCIYYAII